MNRASGSKRLSPVTMLKHPATIDADQVADNLQPNVQNDGGHASDIVVAGRAQVEGNLQRSHTPWASDRRENQVEVLELAAWGFDDYPYRPAHLAQEAAALPEGGATPPLFPGISAVDEAAMRLHAKRTDLIDEMRGLDWSLGAVDLRGLLSFQRRLAFNPQAPRIPLPDKDDFSALLHLCLAPPKPVVYTAEEHGPRGFLLHAADPNVQLRVMPGAESPLTVYSGSPFLEVAEFRDRWFLRDGYHRAYTLLKGGIHTVPAVLIHARTLAELGATQEWFFDEDVLFGEHPPRVIDFLDRGCTIRYTRPALLKRVRISIDESFVEGFNPASESGDAA